MNEENQKTVEEIDKEEKKQKLKKEKYILMV